VSISAPSPPVRTGSEAVNAPATVPASTRSATSALTRQALRDARTRTLAFAYLFAIYAYIQPAGFRHAYPTVAERAQFAKSFAGNDALRLFYGYPYNAVSVGGYSAWRVGGTLAIAAAVFGVLAAVRALRTEEETGRAELVLAGAVGRTGVYTAALAAIAIQIVVLWAAESIGFVLGGLPVGEAAYLALATASVTAVFAGLGAVASQLAPTRRGAIELGSGAVCVFWAMRVIADTSSGAGWLRWLTPLGWAEQLRPFAGAQPLVLALGTAATIVLAALAGLIAARRDVGTGVLPARDSAAPNLRLLGSPSAYALRAERGSLIAWAAGVGAFGLILGMLSASISSAGITKGVREELARVGAGFIATPSGYIAFAFLFFILVISLFVCAQVAAVRREESEQRLETLLALPVGRRRWLAGRLGLASAAAVALALVASVLTWAGASSQGVSISLTDMLQAGANCLPVALLFGGLAALAYALVPRASVGIAYGLVTIAFLWQLVGSLLGVPKWLVEATPFAHVGLVPTQSFRVGSAAVMLAIACTAALASLWAFSRRDLEGV